MIRLFSLLFLSSISIALICQNMDPDQYLKKGEQVPQVLLLGTFHFGYPGLDSHKTKEAYKLDILSSQRQEELRELLDYIKKYDPTKIMIEAGSNTGYLMNRLRRWKKGEEQLGRRESDQIGIRLMDELQLDTIYGIDAPSLMTEMMQSKDSTCFKNYFSYLFDDREEKKNLFEDRYWAWYEMGDQRAYEMKLLDYFKSMNTDKTIERMHGHYILNDHYDDYNSMDGWFLLNWYSRNLRVIKNLQKIDSQPDDRILVLFGAGHIAILKQQLEASPEYELVKFSDLEGY